MTRTPNGFVMAIVVGVTTLFSEGTFKLWGSISGTGGVVEFLDLNISTLNIATSIVQEAKKVVLQVQTSDVVG